MDKETLPIPTEDIINASLIYYFTVSPNFDEESTPEEEIANLIKTGTRRDWIYNYLDLLARQLTIEQQQFVQALYSWVTCHSDFLRFLELDEDEQVIADYIRNKFP